MLWARPTLMVLRGEVPLILTLKLEPGPVTVIVPCTPAFCAILALLDKFTVPPSATVTAPLPELPAVKPLLIKVESGPVTVRVPPPPAKSDTGGGDTVVHGPA